MRPLDPTVLDDLTYDELVARALQRLPHLAPEWTDHNPSDPGIMIIELLAWITDSLLFQTEQVSDDALRALTALVAGPEVRTHSTATALSLATNLITERARAVTPDDIVELVEARWPRSSEAERAGFSDERFVVLAVLPGRRPSPQGVGLEPATANHTTVVIRPLAGFGLAPADVAPAVDALGSFLDDRRLVGCYLHTAVARTRELTATFDVAPQPTVAERAARLTAEDAIVALLDPVSGGAEGNGWPLGRAVEAPEVLAAIDRREREVDYVENLMFADTSGERMPSVDLAEDELPLFVRADAEDLDEGQTQ